MWQKYFYLPDESFIALPLPKKIGYLKCTFLHDRLILKFLSINPSFLLVPSLPPSNVTAQGMNSSSVLVSWGPVPKEGRDGIVIGYGLFYSKHDVSPPNWKQQTCYNTYWCAITNLDVYTHYDIKVTSLTVKGFGVPAFVEAVTEKGGKFS